MSEFVCPVVRRERVGLPLQQFVGEPLERLADHHEPTWIAELALGVVGAELQVREFSPHHGEQPPAIS